MAILSELLHENEIDQVKKHPENMGNVLSIEFNKLTVEQLSNIAFMLIRTEYKNHMPKCILSAEAINILTERAQERNINLF